MKIFISWSGQKSKAVAELLDWWLQCVLQAIDPWMSSKDIDRGSLWFSEITDQLKDTCTGIICLTNSNKEKPWILFEAGALAKGLSSSRVCTLLVDLSPTDVKDPLAQFNHTMPGKDGIWSLVRTLNNCLGEKALKESILEKVFETYWPQFDEKFREINSITELVDEKPDKRPKDDILNEILYTTRSMDKRIRDLENRPGTTFSGLYEFRRPRRDEVGPMVKEMIEAGMPLDRIEQRISRLGVPSSIIKSAIADCIEQNSNKVG